jgi:dTDP-4-amino-4,6-dideoxygalactose transaminase
VRQLRNFGHVTPESFDVVGVNAKMSELHAAMGLAVLVDLEAIVEARRLRTERYDQLLVGSVSMPARPPDMVPNYAYYPILLKDQEERETVLMNLLQEGVSARRYFSPALNTLPYVNSPAMPVAEDAARRALCLPLSAALALQDVERIAKTVIRGR